jgi:lactate dehydrogenase-like 2-hydroxyacid dehydrogenase
MKIFVYNLRTFDEKPYFEQFSKYYGYEYGYTEEYPTLENAELAKGYDTINILVCDMNAPMIEKFSLLGIKYIVTRTIGTDHIDIKCANKLGIKVSNISYPPNSVANYTIMMMMMSCRRITHILKSSELQDYSLKGKMGREISQCTIGIIGTGRIGSSILQHLSGFGCSLLAFDLHQNNEVVKCAEYVDLETLFRESDIISINVPSNPDNYHLIDEDSLALMKDKVIIINTARGDLIDTDALISALESGKVGAAALDVIENESGLYYLNRSGEPINNHNLALLRSFPNVIISPHTAFYTDESISNMVENSFKTLLNFENKE